MRALAAWLRSWSLSRRIAAAMIISLFAVQAQAFVQVRLTADPEVRLTGTRWLAETIGASVREAMTLPPEKRASVLRERSRDLPVRLDWRPERPWTVMSADPVGLRLAATLHDVLGSDAAAIQVASTRLLYLFPIDSLRVRITPGTVTDRLGAAPVHASEPEVLIPVSLRVAVRLGDGSWVSADPIGFDDGQAVRLVPATALLAGAAIVALVSTVTARRIMAPLGRLIVAAEAVGASREPVSVPRAGLGEFAAVARAFEDMQRRLIRFVSERTQLLAAVSHDLRSALTRLRIAVENRADPPAILAEVDEMTAMLDSTLAFAGEEAKASPDQRVDVAALLISLADEFADSGAACDYRGPDHCVVAGHALSLKRAFANVIDNALKYGGAARIRLEAGPGEVRVVVADDGPGIPPALVDEAFRPFRRLDPARGGQPGMGLGLTIARDVMNGHGGRLSLRLGAAGGLEAVFAFPTR